MATWLKQSTAIDISVGPFVDAADGVTPETALTITQPDIRLKKNGGAWAQKNAAQTLSHEENGWYEIALDATDTNTLGNLLVAVNESGALPVWREFQVVPANVWDSFFGADRLQVHADEITAGLITAAAIATGAIDADAIADNAIDAGAIATGAITAAKFAAGAIDAAALAADAGTEIATAVWASGTRTLTASLDPTAAAIADAVWEEAVADHSGTVGSTAAALVADVTVSEATAQDIAAFVWEVNLSLFSGAPGTTAEALGQIPTDIDGLTLTEWLRIMGAAIAGKASGMATTTATFRDLADTKNRIVATVDADGNRTAITLDAS